MAPQTHFNIKRFFKTFKYDLILNGKTYLLFLAAMAIFLFGYNYFHILNINGRESYADGSNTPIYYYIYRLSDFYQHFIVLFFIASIFVVGTSFPMLRKKYTTVTYLLLPSSALEKWLVQFCIRFVIFTFFYILFYILAYTIAVDIFFMFDHVNDVQIQIFSFSEIIKDIDVGFYIGITAFIGVTFFTFFGTTYFKKYAIFKTIALFALLAVAYFYLFATFTHIFIPNYSSSFTPNSFTRNVTEALTNQEVFILVLFGGSTIFLAPMAYFKLKEKEL